MSEYLRFTTPGEFRRWLERNGASSQGVWLLLGKPGGPQTLKASEALEEALCCGWIDGQMRRLDGVSYIKYFSPRRPNSKWSDKNKALVSRLEAQGRMTDRGREKIEEAKQNGQWDPPSPPPVTQEQIALVSDLLLDYQPAHANFQAMPPSVKRTYTRAYLDAKTDAGRASRLSWMVERLNKNLRPM